MRSYNCKLKKFVENEIQQYKSVYIWLEFLIAYIYCTVRQRSVFLVYHLTIREIFLMNIA